MGKHYLITGGAGFIGSNYVNRLLQRGETVTIFDNLSRAGAVRNIRWLKEVYGEKGVDLVLGDVRETEQVARAAKQADVIVHLAAQVAV
ncbi:MAG TPA: GDP-mannose 4,6-dehydratase, partial [Anaerolineaceae bacterium]|nr:GDP-mannose 4,6-dehydratase [Anaerolineaceae bacterium]